MRRDPDRAIHQTKMAQDSNWTGSYMKPGRTLYAHRWSWDLAFNAIGYTRCNPGYATQEFMCLSGYQSAYQRVARLQTTLPTETKVGETRRVRGEIKESALTGHTEPGRIM